MNPRGVVMSAEQVRATPVRLQRSRAKGSRLVSPNGLEIVSVTRPGKWGNSFSVRYRIDAMGMTPEAAAADAVDLFCLSMTTDDRPNKDGEAERIDWMRANLELLRGKNLACWCRLCQKHADAGKPLDEDCPDCGTCHADVFGAMLYGFPCKPKGGRP